MTSCRINCFYRKHGFSKVVSSPLIYEGLSFLLFFLFSTTRLEQTEPEPNEWPETLCPFVDWQTHTHKKKPHLYIICSLAAFSGGGRFMTNREK